MTMPKTTDKPDALTRLLAMCGPLRGGVFDSASVNTDAWQMDHMLKLTAYVLPALVRMIEEGLVCDECCAGLRDAWNAIAEEVLGK